MIQSTLSALLVSVASRYAQLSPSDVGIGIGGGRLVIDDVKLRAETFNSPSLPFHVYQGRAGRLRVNVPWSALSSSPVEVYLENIHLIAGPKQSVPSAPDDDIETVDSFVSKKDESRKSRKERQKAPWHQTSVGRLAFNVSVEMYGVKVEYRDDSCVGVMSVASIRAFSADREWNSRFASLALDSDDDFEDTTTAVTMRKVVRLSGVHWVMIPRGEEKERDPSEEMRPQLDLDSFESQAPIVDGIGITVRVLLCTGKARIEPDLRVLTPGLHTEVEIDLEEPKVNLTARQMKWIDHILKQGFGGAKVSKQAQESDASPMSNGSHLSPYTKRRPRSVSSSSVPKQTVDQTDVGNGTTPTNLGQEVTGRGQSSQVNSNKDLQAYENATSLGTPDRKTGYEDGFGDEAIDAEIDKVSEYDDDPSYSEEEDLLSDGDVDKARTGGGFFSFWQAIVGENGDETIDDAAVALGLSNGSKPHIVPVESLEEDEIESKERAYALNAVEAAAKAGGLTTQVRLKTPDVTAWDLVEQLRGEAEHDQEKLGRLRDIEEILQTAEARVRSSEAEVQSLKERNAALLKELQDLERMTSQAGRNKDAMIRQMEAALTKAERNLQAMMQAQFQESTGAVDASRTSPVGKGPPLPIEMMENETVPASFEQSSKENGAMNWQTPTKDRVVVPSAIAADDMVKEETSIAETVSVASVRSEPITPRLEKQEVNEGVNTSERKSTGSTPIAVLRPDSNREPSSAGEASPMRYVQLENYGDEHYLRSLSSHKLEEAMSSEGLTLI